MVQMCEIDPKKITNLQDALIPLKDIDITAEQCPEPIWINVTPEEYDKMSLNMVNKLKKIQKELHNPLETP